MSNKHRFIENLTTLVNQLQLVKVKRLHQELYAPNTDLTTILEAESHYEDLILKYTGNE